MPSVNENEVFTIWVNGSPSNLVLNCWKSWVLLGYKVVIYVDDAFGKTWKLPPQLCSRISIKHLRSLAIVSFDYNEGKLLHFIDLSRFIILSKYGGTFLDSDMFLIKRLPTDKIIISSEHTLKSGAFKSKVDRKPNIGCLRFCPGHPFTKAVVEKMTPTTKEDLNDNINQTSKMLKFIKMLKTKKWSYLNEYVVEPQMFCPIPWCFAKELYMSDKFTDFKPKYGLEFNYTDDNTCGIHMWNNFKTNKFKIQEKDIHKDSLYSLLKF